MRSFIMINVVVAVGVIALFIRMPEDPRIHMLFVFAPFLVVSIFVGGYGAKLAERDHSANPEKFKKYSGSNNLPIWGALWRAAQAGDRRAKWAMAWSFGAPFIFALLMFGPLIVKRIAN